MQQQHVSPGSQQASATVPAAPPTQPQQILGRIGRRKLILQRISTLPNRCVKCNEDVDHRRKRIKLTYVLPWAYLGLLGGVLPFVILAVVLRRTAVIELPVCSRHRATPWIHGSVGMVIIAAGVLAIPIGITQTSTGIGLAGVAGIFFGLGYIAILTPLVRPSRIEKAYVIVRGCHPKFLDHFPELDPRTLRPVQMAAPMRS